MTSLSHSSSAFVRRDTPLTVSDIEGHSNLTLRFGDVCDNVTIFIERADLERLSAVIGEFLASHQVEDAA